jgi:hypothetical protein
MTTSPLNQSEDRTESSKATRSRRGLLVAGGALAAGAVAALARTNEADAAAETKTSADTDATLAVENTGSGYAIIARQTATSPTTPGFAALKAERAGDLGGQAVYAVRSGDGPGFAVMADRRDDGLGDAVQALRGSGGKGNGVRGIHFGSGDDDVGAGANGAGVRGERHGNIGLLGVGPRVIGPIIDGPVPDPEGPTVASSTDTGVFGQGLAFGVRGECEEGSGTGVHGQSRSATGTGAVGEATVSGGVGLEARHTVPGGMALRVAGRASFLTVGQGTIPAHANSAVVTNSNVTAVSHITITLTSNPGDAPGNQTDPAVKWVSRNPGAGFTIHTTRPVLAATTFTYLIVEPAF